MSPALGIYTPVALSPFAIPIYIDDRFPDIYMIDGALVGSESAFGAFYAVNLAAAYRPDDVWTNRLPEGL